MPEQGQTSPDPLRPGYEMAELDRWFATEAVLEDIHAEREAQHAQWGEQDIPMGTHQDFTFVSRYYRALCQRKTQDGDVTYADVLLEEVYEALAETDPQKLRDELIQVAAVAVKMVELIDKHTPTPAPAEG